MLKNDKLYSKKNHNHTVGSLNEFPGKKGSPSIILLVLG